MSSLITNGNGYHRCSAIDSKELNGYLFMFQEVYKPLETAIDEFAYKTDDREQALSKAISAFVEDNLSLIDEVSLENKIAVIFDAYRDAYLNVLKEEQSYSKALNRVKQSQLQHFGSSEQIEQAVEQLVLERIKTFHSITPANAIQRYMGLQTTLSFSELPDAYTQRNCEKNALIDFFRNTIKA